MQCAYHARPARVRWDDTPLCSECAYDLIYDLEDGGDQEHADALRSNLPPKGP